MECIIVEDIVILLLGDLVGLFLEIDRICFLFFLERYLNIDFWGVGSGFFLSIFFLFDVVRIFFFFKVFLEDFDLVIELVNLCV